jgi:hypothetical protein
MPQAATLFRKALMLPAFLFLLPVAGMIISLFEQRWRTIALAAIPIAFLLWFGSSLLRRLEILFTRFARRRALAIISVAVLALAASAAIAASKGIREPEVTDEFSYLLSADTFAHGRLSNPTPPMWTHFETIHVIQQPTYASKYPPGQGMILAAGKIIAGLPIVGVWIAMAAACGAICWMLMAWTNPKWGFAGGVMMLFHPMFIEWSQSYWGGALAMAGGALITGASARIIRHRRVRDSILMGLGIMVLASTRPYEGMILSLLSGITIIIGVLKKKDVDFKSVLQRIVLPMAAMLMLTAVWIGYYNFRVTGNPIKLPYAVHEEKYGIAPLFLFQELKPEPHYNHRELRQLHAGWELNDFLNQQSVEGVTEGALYKLKSFLTCNLRDLIFLIPLIALPVVLTRDRKTQVATAIVVITVAAVLAETWYLPHYTSLITGVILVIVLRSMMTVNRWRWRGMAMGRQTIRATVLLSAIMLVTFWVELPPVDVSQWNYQRARMIKEFGNSGEQHLVLVRYGPEHMIHQEWVHNGADINSSPVLWARSMGDKEDHELVEYFKNRWAWILEVDKGIATLKPYEQDSTNGMRN